MHGSWLMANWKSDERRAVCLPAVTHNGLSEVVTIVVTQNNVPLSTDGGTRANLHVEFL